MNLVRNTARTMPVFFFFVFIVKSTAFPDDWPAYRCDYRRSGITREKLSLPLVKAWVFSSPAPPQKAWSGPAKWDAYAGITNLKSMRDFDPAFYVSTAGDTVFFGSSVDDAVHCLDAHTGREKWIFFTGAAVRVAPAVAAGRVYFGSDDGFVYCVDAERGVLIWKFRPGPEEELLPCNGQLISRFPCRTGVMVKDNRAVFGASLLPWRPSYLCAVNAGTGKLEGSGTFRRSFDAMTMQGALLASDTRIYIPQGRQRPRVFSLETGKHLGAVGGGGNGGCFALLGPEYSLVHGRGQNHGSDGALRIYDRKTNDAIVTFGGAVSMVVDRETAWFNTGDAISAFQRTRYLSLQKERNKLKRRGAEIQKAIKASAKKGEKENVKKLKESYTDITEEIKNIVEEAKQCFLWKEEINCLHEIILAGDTVFAGGTDRVVALESRTGKKLWSTRVDGKAFGLAAANGRLFVSTHTGAVYCFETVRKTER